MRGKPDTQKGACALAASSVNLACMPKRFFLIVYKDGNQEAGDLAHNIACWLSSQDIDTNLQKAGIGISYDKKPDLTIVLGGDGTILGVARILAGSNVPILGINFGRVGFLTSLEVSEWREGLAECVAGRLPLRKCMAMNWKIRRLDEIVGKGIAVNDVVVGRGALARLVNIHIGLDNEDMGLLRSDGIIACTPLGSTAYSTSAGGPAIYPELPVLSLTPICAFMPKSFPMILPHTASIKFTICDDPGDSYLTIDGQEGLPLLPKDEILVNGWPDAIQFLGESSHFYSRLATRGFSFK